MNFSGVDFTLSGQYKAMLAPHYSSEKNRKSCQFNTTLRSVFKTAQHIKRISGCLYLPFNVL